MEKTKISFIGAGNVAYRLSISFVQKGIAVPHIYNRSLKAASTLARILNKEEINAHSLPPTSYTDRISDLDGDPIIIIAVSDDAIAEIITQISRLDSVKSGKSIVLHTSGSTDINLLKEIPRHGVFYPLMTLSKIKSIEINTVPFLIEASDTEVEQKLISLAERLRAEYQITDSIGRLKYHLAAVFVSNFVNHILGIAFDIARENYMLLMPLALETIRKAFLYDHPKSVQTGPAKRGDMETIGKHIELLNKVGKSEWVELYKLITKMIIDSQQTDSDKAKP